jgi:hypothetical protein
MAGVTVSKGTPVNWWNVGATTIWFITGLIWTGNWRRAKEDEEEIRRIDEYLERRAKGDDEWRRAKEKVDDWNR